jgi:hypothetical protein
MSEKNQSPPSGATELLWTGQIDSRPYWNDVPLMLQGGGRYYLRASDQWLDWHTECTANGYDKGYMTLAKGLLRCQAPGATWFTLIGSIEQDTGTQFVIGDGSRWPDGWIAPKSGRLSCFANDGWWFYWNNKGTVTLEIWQ